jgi:hypothetical protein
MEVNNAVVDYLALCVMTAEAALRKAGMDPEDQSHLMAEMAEIAEKLLRPIHAPTLSVLKGSY